MLKNTPTLLHTVLLFGLFFLLIYLSFSVLHPFIIPVVWAMIIAYMTWPIYQYIEKKCGSQRKTLSSFLMVGIIVLVIGIPLVFVITVLQHEGRHLFLEIQAELLSGQLSVPPLLSELPIVGHEIEHFVDQVNQNPSKMTQSISVWLQAHISYGKVFLSEISSGFFKLFFALFSLFFFYRDGRNILAQVRIALEKVIGSRIDHYMQTISETTRAVVYGIGLTALAQAVLAGLSYFVAGVPNPVLLTLATFLLALIPFGTPISYTAVTVWLLSQGQVLPAVGVMVWGVCVVSTSDNVIRPMVISGATKIPFLLIMFGVLGGIASFGLIGLFIGPIVLAILLATWREWINQS